MCRGSGLLLAHLVPDRDGKRGLNFVLGLIDRLFRVSHG